MSFWNDLKAKAAELNADLGKVLARINNRTFAEAAMATCALIAAADGTISSEEKVKTSKYITINPVMKNFDTVHLQDRFKFYAGELESDIDFGREACYEAIKRVTDPEQAIALVKVGIAIGGADGDFDADEKATVAKVGKMLHVDLRPFDLA